MSETKGLVEVLEDNSKLTRRTLVSLGLVGLLNLALGCAEYQIPKRDVKLEARLEKEGHQKIDLEEVFSHDHKFPDYAEHAFYVLYHIDQKAIEKGIWNYYVTGHDLVKLFKSRSLNTCLPLDSISSIRKTGGNIIFTNPSFNTTIPNTFGTATLDCGENLEFRVAYGGVKKGFTYSGLGGLVGARLLLDLKEGSEDKPKMMLKSGSLTKGFGRPYLDINSLNIDGDILHVGEYTNKKLKSFDSNDGKAPDISKLGFKRYTEDRTYRQRPYTDETIAKMNERFKKLGVEPNFKFSLSYCKRYRLDINLKNNAVSVFPGGFISLKPDKDYIKQILHSKP